MTAIVFVSIGIAFILGIRGTFFVAMTLVALVVAAIQLMNGQYFAAVFDAFAMQAAYIVGLLVNAMRR